MSVRVYILGIGCCLFSWMALSAMAEEPPQSNTSPEAMATPQPPASTVAVLDRDWVDQSRDRHVPVRIYYPVNGSQPLAVIIVSHGLGGSRFGYAYLGRYWADHGFVVVHLQHLGSDSTAWKSATSPAAAMRKVVQNIQTTTDRPRDVSFVLDQLEELATAEGPLQGRLDLARVGVAGHSMGAHTALLMAGETLLVPDSSKPKDPKQKNAKQKYLEQTFTDPRVKAVVAMSPPVRRAPGYSNNMKDAFKKTYGSIGSPCLFLTGTRDESRVGLTDAQDRRVPFDSMRLADRYLVIFKDADHMIFADRRSSYQHNFEAMHRLICRVTTAFWNAYLRDSAQAASWLADGRFQDELGDLGTLEIKNK